MFSVIRNHPTPPEKAVAVRRAQELGGAATRQSFVGQTNRVTNSSTKDASNNI
jgi:hypothetical protein